MRWSKVLVLGLALVIAPAARADLPAPVQQEIDHLIRYIGDSGCAFERNGTWSNAKAAQSHVRSKYDFLVKLGMIDTAQDFIDKAATQSSLSGQPYEVRCGRDSTTPTSFWLSSELARYRASRHSSH
ncbi:MAG TPA: DUF5329 domain-containing protein [Burkholderiales bacterium]|nr:DUF5329 domain-containing protein [Burkholderiales bacterium]